ncbi:MAG: PD40 domain-containing protein [Deltaproteobacteria bacterium]|nr:PD40 domain-containing protein [Deltaproteobacteria bacterium]MBK8716701.1 PD40 domain-containing protein [Deltaproteobacteria bacterium]MBP7285332.1 PD40 domain-containing protein [Nannocystaceae bacterium]
MKRTLLGTTTLISLLALGAYWAGQDVATVNAAPDEPQHVGGSGVVLLELGVPAGDEVGEVIRRDAELSAGFHVIDRKSIPAALIKETGFDRDQWNAVGAQAVIKNADVGGQIKFQLYDLAKGNKPVLSLGFPGGDKRKAAHKFMNEVIKYYTGTPGVFGSRIAFVRTRRSPEVSKNVFTMEMDGGNVAGITNNRSLNILPSIGPSGQVVFTSYAKRNPDLWISSGGEPTRISKQPGLNLGGVMSPQGGTIALTLSKDGNSEIYLIDQGGGIKSRLTNNAAIDGSPSWSPAGNQLAFVSSRAGGPQIFRMTSAGGSASRLSKKGEYNQTPDWSPGEGEYASWVAYAGREGSNFDIFAVNVKSGQLKRITQGGGRHTDPSYAPDGRLISFNSSSGGIVIANEDGNNQIPVMKAGTTPDWGPRAL